MIVEGSSRQAAQEKKAPLVVQVSLYTLGGHVRQKCIHDY